MLFEKITKSEDTSIKLSINNKYLSDKLIKNLEKTYFINDIIDNWKWCLSINKKEQFVVPDYLPNFGEYNHEIEHGEKAYITESLNDGIHIWKNGAFWLRIKDNEIYLEGEDTKILYEIARKAVRQIFTFELEQNNGFRLHSSSFELNGQGITFLGYKRAGKTTLLLSFIAYLKAKYITNDILEVRWSDNKNCFLINGWPTVCLVGRGTLNAIDKYRNLLPDEDNASDSLKPKVAISINEIEQILDTEIVQEATLNIICFPKLNLDRQNTHVNQISPTEGFELMKEHIINEDEDHPDWLKLRYNLNEQQQVIDSIQQHIEQVMFFEIEVGSDLEAGVQTLYDTFNVKEKITE